MGGGQSRPARPSDRQQDEGAERNPQEDGRRWAELGKQVPGDGGADLDRGDGRERVVRRRDTRRATSRFRIEAQVDFRDDRWPKIFTISSSWAAR